VRTTSFFDCKPLQVAVLMLLASALAFGQATSQISGTVKDNSGAVIGGVKVSLTQTDTGTVREVLTDETGFFVATSLLPGPYRIEASAPGFQTYIQTGIQLQVDSSPRIPITLGVSSVNETVQVEANASLVDIQKLGVGTVMESERVLELPLNGRTPTDLISLTPGAVQTAASPVWNMNTGVQISVAGGQPYGVYYALDGAPHLSMYDATNMPLPFPDALQEFKVDTSSQEAQAGTHAGAQVNSVTKGGTNEFHGDLFEFFRNGDLNARNFFSPAQDTLKRNQFGGTIGGPIKRNHIFFFAGYQGTTLRQTPAPTTTFTLTPQELAGDFSVFASSRCQASNVTLRAPFTTINGVPNQLPQDRISPVALKIASYLPASADPCGKFLTSTRISQYFWQVPVRVDYQLSSTQTLFVRYMGTKQTQVLPYKLTPTNIFTAGGNAADDLATSLVLGHTWVVSPTKVNSLRLSMNRVAEVHPGSRYFGPSDVGINAYSYVPHALSIAVTGGPSVGSGVGEDLNNFDTYLSANDDFTWTHGSHQVAFGASTTHSLISALANVRAIGNYTFNGQTTGLGTADFMAGILSQLVQSRPNPLYLHQWFVGAYLQDTWKVSPRLTVNGGIRWEPAIPMQLNDKSIYTFSLARYYAGTHSRVWANAPTGFYYPGDPGFNGNAGINTHWGQFAPRLGLAWDPSGNGKMSIRAGAGLAYDFINEQMYLNSDLAAPFYAQTYVLGSIPVADPWSALPTGNPFPYVSAPPGNFPAFSSYLPLIPTLKSPRTYSWNLLVQRQVSSSLFLSANYVGSQSVHLFDNIELNPGVYIPGNCVAGQYGLTVPGPCSNLSNINYRRVLYLQDPVASQTIANLTQFDDGATSNYHALILAAQWRPTRNVNLNVNDTWSHCIGDNSTGNGTNNVATNYVHLANRALDRGNCAWDRRNLFNLTVVARTPRFSSPLLRAGLSDWSVSTIYRRTSGTPLTILAGIDQVLAGFTSERPNQILVSTAAPNQGQACVNIAPCVSWLNPSAFAQPGPGTLGNMGTYNVLSPAFFQFDAALVREFPVREHQTLQFRAEAFNLPNNVRFGTPSVTLSSPNTFGRILSAYDPRILQLAMKLKF
jgi:hypothetical protein